MYRLLIRKINRDDTLPQEEKSARIVNILDFWSKNEKKIKKLDDNLKTDKNHYGRNYFKYLGYMMKFKLLCEGEEIKPEKTFPFDFDGVFEFMSEIEKLAKE